MNFEHVSVMLMPTVDMLDVREGGVYVDGTLGGGGHSAEILRRLNGTGHLYGIDRDNDALAAATERLGAAGNFTAVKGNFHDVKALLAERGVEKIDGMMIDLGVSSHQLDTAERGFSYHADAPLDMRMDQDQPLTAREIVNTWSAAEITRILRDYSEEKWAAPHVSGAAHRGQRRAGPAQKGAGGHGGAAEPRRPSGGADVPLAGGSHRQADVPAAGESLHLPAENPSVHLRQKAGRARFGRRRNQAGRAGGRAQPACQKRDAARLREAGDAGVTLRGQSREPFFRNGRMALRL